MMGALSVALIGRLALMTGPAQRLKVAVIVCTTMCFGLNVVDCRGCCNTPIPHAVLAEVFISCEYPCAANVPRTAVPTFLSALALLMLLPSGVYVVRAVT